MIGKKLLLAITWIIGIAGAESSEFAQKFIAHYDLTKRDTHEYNPYLLNKTRISFLQLEKALIDAGLSVSGRYTILGYQEEAVPPYTTDWERHAIDDEAIVKTDAGLALPSRNIFGFITGFLLKDAQWMQAHWNKSALAQIMHICARPVQLFADSAFVFQKHAFGKDYDIIMSARDKVESAVHTRNLSLVLKELINFWCIMQERVSKTGSQETVATQDMDFSLSYAQALFEGKTPIKNVFIGPDITYPIEVLSIQNAQATLHAQEFIELFQKYMVPVNGESTAYIFCSFVDGVGKSTLLGNMQNFAKYGTDFTRYERCDNSSSQATTVYKVKNNVHIVDLPGQMSHFAVKPDGYVFSDIQTVTEISDARNAELSAYIIKNKDALRDAATQLLKNEATSKKYLYDEPNKMKQYAQNCVLFGIKDFTWVPFEFERATYIFNIKSNAIRMLVPIGSAHSLGLKTIEPEQMLFSKGLSLPMRYEVFLSDLIEKLTKIGIKKVMLVDFLSMYPRSSRETIRLNFVLQYLKKIFGDSYDLEHSFYSHKMHKAQETCALLLNHYPELVATFSSETALRWSLDSIMCNLPQNFVTTIAGKELQEKIENEIKKIIAANDLQISELVQKRLESEREIYFNAYELDRVYQTIVRFNAAPLIALSESMNKLSSEYLASDHMKALWSDFDAMWQKGASSLDNGIGVSVFSAMHKTMKDEATFKEFVRPLRAMLYTQAANFLQVVPTHFAVPPFKVVEIENVLYVLQKRLLTLDTTALKLPSLVQFHVFDKSGKVGRWGMFNDLPYYLDWNTLSSHFGIYAFMYSVNQNKNIITSLVDAYRKNKVDAGLSNPCMPVVDLYAAALTGGVKEDLEKGKQAKKMKEIDSQDPNIRGIRLWARIIATIELVIKDPEARIVARKENKADFIATIRLLEMITLPYYFGIKLKQPLFDDYSAVEPIIDWP